MHPSSLRDAAELPPSLLTRRHGAVAALFLNRPAKRNALDDATLLGIEEFFTHLPDDVTCVVLAAQGDHFSAGLDLSEMGEHDTISGVRHSRMWHRVLELVEFGPVPVVCALQGAVVGGGMELAAAAHLRVADRSAFYALPEGMRGLFVGGGGSVRLPRLIGVARMADLMLTGRRYDAEEGQAVGLSQYLVEKGAAFDRALELATLVAANAPQSNYAIVQALPRIAEANPREGYFMEAMIAAIAQGTDDAKGRMRDFLEGRAEKVTDR